MEPAERQLQEGVDGQVALEAEQKRACRGAASEGDQPEARGVVPGAQQLPEAASDPCGADWSRICRSAAPPEPVEAVRNAGSLRVRERSNTALPCPPEWIEAHQRRRKRSGGRSGHEAENRSGFSEGEERAGDESAEGRSKGTLRSERLPLVLA